MKQFKKNLLKGLLWLYAFNIIYFSLNTFLDGLITKPNDDFYFLPEYGHFVNEDSLFGKIFYSLRLSSGYAFFGRGLAETVEINFIFFDKKHNILRKNRFSDAFVSASGRIRGITLPTRLTYSIMERINTQQLMLKQVSKDTTYHKTLRSNIRKDKKILDIFLKRMGLFTGKESNDWQYFIANVYFLSPNRLYAKAGTKPIERTIILYRKIEYDRGRNKILHEQE